MRHSAVTALWVAVLCFAIVQAGRAATQNSIGVQDQAQSATPASASAPTESATPSTPAPPPSAADPSASPAALAPASDANGQGPLVAYVTHSKPPALVDTTVVSAELGMIGAIGAMSQGHDIVVKNNIADPSGEMAHEIATAYAAANGGRVAETPIPDDSFEGSAK